MTKPETSQSHISHHVQRSVVSADSFGTVSMCAVLISSLTVSAKIDIATANFHLYFLRVPPHIETAKEVAWTLGFREREYAPEQES